MKPTLSTRILVVLGAVCAAIFAIAQAGPPSIKAKLTTVSVKAGKVAKGTVTLSFEPGWHGYQNPPMGEYEIPVKVESETKDIKIKVSYPKGMVKDSMGNKSAVYEGTIDFPFEFTAPKKPGSYKLKIKANYQQCDDQSCLPPGVVSVEIPFKVVK